MCIVETPYREDYTFLMPISQRFQSIRLCMFSYKPSNPFLTCSVRGGLTGDFATCNGIVVSECDWCRRSKVRYLSPSNSRCRIRVFQFDLVEHVPDAFKINRKHEITRIPNAYISLSCLCVGVLSGTRISTCQLFQRTCSLTFVFAWSASLIYYQHRFT